jgi:predicted RNA-binding Zn-ribbon protein involved in translation (DUF1610 family)
MDMSSISAAYEGLKIGKSLLQTAFEKKAEELSEEKIRQILEKLGAAQDTLFIVRETLFELQTENDALKKQIAESEAREERMSSYKLVQTSGGAVVYESQNDPHHYICPSCVEKQSAQILQDNRTRSGKYRCVPFGAEYPIEPHKPAPSTTPARF